MDTQQRRHIANAIKTARLRHGWTTTEAAAQLDTSDANWSRWETASATPRPATLLALGDLLGLPEGWWEMPDEPSLSHPPSTVDDIAEQLERIERTNRKILDEVIAERERIEQLYRQMMNGDDSATGRDRDRQGRSGSTVGDSGIDRGGANR